MECNECGSLMREEARACLGCGAPVRRVVPAADRMQVAAAGVPSWFALDSTRPVGQTDYPASRLQRILAVLVDSVILLVLGALLTQVVGAQSITVDDSGRVVFDWIPFLALFALNASYTIAFPATCWQGTPGKKLFGIRIVTLSHTPIGLPRSAWRWACQQLIFLVVVPLGMITVVGILAVPIALLIVCGDGKSPWDKMAGTMVVS